MLLDRFISFFSPSLALRRAQNRFAFEKIRGYQAAERTKQNSNWKPIDSQAYELGQNSILRVKSKDLFKNNSLARRATKTIRNNAIGTGIMPAISDEPLKEVWDEWADSTRADFDEKMNFYGLQALAIQTMLVQGNFLMLRIKTKSSRSRRVPLELKAVPITHLDNTKDTMNTAGAKIINGIEFLSSGKLKGFWIYDESPLDNIRAKSTFWAKEDVIHLFECEEPGAIMGVPNGVSSFNNLKDLAETEDAQIVKQKIAACFAAFIQDANDTGDTDPDDESDTIDRVEPGTVETLPAGKTIQFANPPSADGANEFTRGLKQSAAAGYGVTYESMTNDLSNVNFSSGRMGRNEFGRDLEHLQWNTFIPIFCDKVWEWFVEAAILTGRIKKETKAKIKWTTPRTTMIDPVKETQAIENMVRAGFMSYSEALRTFGYAPQDVIKEMIADKAAFDKNGLMPTSDPRFDASRKNQDATDTDRSEQ